MEARPKPFKNHWKIIEKPLKPMVGPFQSIKWWWSNGVKTIGNLLQLMVAREQDHQRQGCSTVTPRNNFAARPYGKIWTKNTEKILNYRNGKNGRAFFFCRPSRLWHSGRTSAKKSFQCLEHFWPFWNLGLRWNIQTHMLDGTGLDCIPEPTDN